MIKLILFGVLFLICFILLAGTAHEMGTHSFRTSANRSSRQRKRLIGCILYALGIIAFGMLIANRLFTKWNPWFLCGFSLLVLLIAVAMNRLGKREVRKEKGPYTFFWRHGTYALHLSFRKGALSHSEKKLIEETVRTAGFDGHVVVADAIVGNGVVTMKKWDHFDWEQVKAAIQAAIQERWPTSQFS